jgi:pimeloyl-ACP methyl ester carboxylesterase
VSTTIFLIVVMLLAATWYYSESIEAELLTVDPWVPELDLEIIGVDEDTITLTRTPEAARDGTWGLEWEGGYAVLGDVVDDDGSTVTRKMSVIHGEPFRGDPAALDPFVVPTDPADLGLTYRDVVFEGPLGGYPAWAVAGTDDTWVIFVHGKGSNRREALRLLPAVSDMGFPAFIISYRNDPEAPKDGRRYDLGDTEWEDLESAVLHALGSGAQDVVIVGYSMGGTVTSLFLRRSAWADRVKGVILDAPLLNPGMAVDAEAERKSVPGFMTGLAKALAGMRFGVDWSVLDQIGRTDDFDAPILVFHGDEDDTVPIEGSRLFAEARPELIRLEEFAGAGHVEAWNVDSERYEETVRVFLDDVALGRSDLDPIVPEG